MIKNPVLEKYPVQECFFSFFWNDMPLSKKLLQKELFLRSFYIGHFIKPEIKNKRIFTV